MCLINKKKRTRAFLFVLVSTSAEMLKITNIFLTQWLWQRNSIVIIRFLQNRMKLCGRYAPLSSLIRQNILSFTIFSVTQRSLAGFSEETVSSQYQSYLRQVSPQSHAQVFRTVRTSHVLPKSGKNQKSPVAQTGDITLIILCFS